LLLASLHPVFVTLLLCYLITNNMSLIDLLSKGIFWDTDPATLDPEKNIYYIIPRVVDYGTMEDVQQIEDYYGPERMLRVLIEAPSLHKKTISFYAWKYGLPVTDFRAYKKQQEWKTWP